jgi:hypothetical protein
MKEKGPSLPQERIKMGVQEKVSAPNAGQDQPTLLS